MSLLIKNGSGILSGIAIDADKSWQGRRIKDLGQPVDDHDAVRKQDAILKEILTAPGQLLYAAESQTPAVLDPETGDKFLKAGSPPVWAAIPASNGYWEKAGESILTAPAGIIEVTGLSTAYEILWVQLISTYSNGWDIKLKFNNSGPYDYSKHIFSSTYGRTSYDNAAEIILTAPSGEGQLFYQFQGFIFQRLANWRKTFTFQWLHTFSANGQSVFEVYQGYWNNQSSKVTGIRFQHGGTFDAQAKLIVLGAG
jgi:hypothetical protein